MILVRKRHRKAKRRYLLRELFCPRRSPYVNSFNKKSQRARFLGSLSIRVTTLPGKTNLEAASRKQVYRQQPLKKVSVQEAFPRERHVGAHRNIRFGGSTLNPLFKGPTIRGFWTPAPGLQNPSGISGPARPPGFGQDPWPESNPSSLSCQDAYRRSTCWAAHWASNPYPRQFGGAGSARNSERHG